MKKLSLAIFAIGSLAFFGNGLVDAQERVIDPPPPLQLHAVNPSMSLSTPASNPLQEQMREDYATTLMNDRRQLLQQNPSGATRQERAIGQQLDGYTPR